MKKLFIIFILFAFFAGCSKEPAENCFVCEKSVPVSKLSYVEGLEENVCNKCFNKFEIRCPACKIIVNREDFNDHISICEVYCCVCGVRIYDKEHVFPFYCDSCAKKESLQLF